MGQDSIETSLRLAHRVEAPKARPPVRDKTTL